jgi:hypothetical protein
VVLRHRRRVCPPRIAPYGTYYGYNDPPQNASCAGSIDSKQLDQYPYLPVFTTAGGNRTNLAGFSPAVTNGRVMPTCNHDRRYVFQDDLTKTTGHHTFKTGLYWENDETHAPVSGVNYMGTFNFGSVNTNPLDSGNGYANMLLGVITQYSEVTNRIAWNIGHSEFDAYVQDSWRLNSRLTLDYGLRLTHYPAWYETNDMTAAFYPELTRSVEGAAPLPAGLHERSGWQRRLPECQSTGDRSAEPHRVRPVPAGRHGRAWLRRPDERNQSGWPRQQRQLLRLHQYLLGTARRHGVGRAGRPQVSDPRRVRNVLRLPARRELGIHRRPARVL